jgi:pre-mRNA-processing factor 17
MDLLQSSYAPDDASSPEEAAAASFPDSSPLRLPSKSAAPAVDDTVLALSAAASASRPLDPSLRLVAFNPTADQLWAPVVGPQHPHVPISSASGNRNHKLGHVEDAAVLPFLFDEQYNTFHRFGYAADPSGLHIVGDGQPQGADPDTVYNLAPSENKRRRLHAKQADELNEPPPPEAKNPALEEWVLHNKQSPWAGKREGPPVELTDEQRQYAVAHAAKKAEKEARGEGKEKTGRGQEHLPREGREGLPGAVMDHAAQGCQGHQRPLLHSQEVCA